MIISEDNKNQFENLGYIKISNFIDDKNYKSLCSQLNAEINKKFDDKFNRLWNYYLDYCETGFALSRTDVTQFFLKKII